MKTCLSAPLEALCASFPFVVALWNISPAQTLLLLEFYSEELEVPVSTLKFTRHVAKLFIFLTQGTGDISNRMGSGIGHLWAPEKSQVNSDLLYRPTSGKRSCSPSQIQ